MSKGRSNQATDWRSAFAAGLFRIKPMLSRANFAYRVEELNDPVRSILPKISPILKSVKIPRVSSNTLYSSKPAPNLRPLLPPKKPVPSSFMKINIATKKVKKFEATAPPERKCYLPGDLRYKPEFVSSARLKGSIKKDMTAASNPRQVNPPMPSNTLSKTANSRKRPQTAAHLRQVTNYGGLAPSKQKRFIPGDIRYESQHNEPRSIDRLAALSKKNIVLSNSRNRNARPVAAPRPPVYDEFDDYDSDMDDFIDDSMVEELPLKDFEETLRRLNPRYDKRKYMMREIMIDDRKMDARYRDIQSEEIYSTKMGIFEDWAEARRGSSTNV